MSDAVRDFLRSAAIPVEDDDEGHCHNDPRAEQVIEAGEWLAHGLGLLVSTQLGEKVCWNDSAIRTERQRWRVEFVWGITPLDDLNDCRESHESHESHEFDETDELDLGDESEKLDNEPIGAAR